MGCKIKIPSSPPGTTRVNLFLPCDYQFICGRSLGGEPTRNVTIEITVLRPIDMNTPPTLVVFRSAAFSANNDDNDPDNLEFPIYIPDQGPLLVEVEIIQDCSNCCQTSPDIYCNPPYTGNRGRPRWTDQLLYPSPPSSIRFDINSIRRKACLCPGC